jgi:transcription elongation factor Elf1
MKAKITPEKVVTYQVLDFICPSCGTKWTYHFHSKINEIEGTYCPGCGAYFQVIKEERTKEEGN